MSSDMLYFECQAFLELQFLRRFCAYVWIAALKFYYLPQRLVIFFPQAEYSTKKEKKILYFFNTGPKWAKGSEIMFLWMLFLSCSTASRNVYSLSALPQESRSSEWGVSWGHSPCNEYFLNTVTGWFCSSLWASRLWQERRNLCLEKNQWVGHGRTYLSCHWD